MEGALGSGAACGVVGWAGWSAWSRIKPRLHPRRIERRAAELDAVVQAERPVVPELDQHRHDAVTGPARRPRHAADGVFGGIKRHRLFEGEAAFERKGLLAGPGADLRLLRAGGEIGVRFGIGDGFGRAADTDLPVERLPME